MAGEGFEWSICDPTQCWIELCESWDQAEFKGWLRSSVRSVAARQGEENWLSSAGDDDHWFSWGEEGRVSGWSLGNPMA